jgi:murein DD-endopeptidase MepM/ murein hydrolase activator NlpD
MQKSDIAEMDGTGMKKTDKKILMMLTVAITTVVVVVMLVRSTKAFEVFLDDRPVGIVDSQSTFTDLLESIRKSAEMRYGTDVFVASRIDFKEVYLPDSGRILDAASEQSVSQVRDSVLLEAKVFAINVDGEDIACFRDRASAEQVLERIKAPYLQDAESGAVTGFVETVCIKERVVRESELTELSDPDEVYDDLMQENETIKKYIVQKGDTVSEIAERLGVSIKDIEKANPGIDIDRISIGQELNLSVPRYRINVMQTRTTVYEAPAAYSVEYEETDELYRGETRVKVEGEEGTKLVKACYISINGYPEETRILDETIIREPKKAIVLKGTKPRPRTMAYGEFYWPSRGRITSRYGPRWGEKHSGVDIAAPKGSPIKAADGGVVKFAGWSGNYGRLVIINHENGYTTYYGHCNTIKVKVGQRVARGDVIATVGETGRATGPHLHFEVRKNGVPVNPLNYIK